MFYKHYKINLHYIRLLLLLVLHALTKQYNRSIRHLNRSRFFSEDKYSYVVCFHYSEILHEERDFHGICPSSQRGAGDRV